MIENYMKFQIIKWQTKWNNSGDASKQSNNA